MNRYSPRVLGPLLGFAIFGEIVLIDLICPGPRLIVQRHER